MTLVPSVVGMIETMCNVADIDKTKVSISPEWLRLLLEEANKKPVIQFVPVPRPASVPPPPVAEPVALSSNEEVNSALQEFATHWVSVPALARAAVGGGLTISLGQQGVQDDDIADTCQRLGLNRRTAVYQNCALARIALADLLRRLTLEADAEIDALGLPEHVACAAMLYFSVTSYPSVSQGAAYSRCTEDSYTVDVSQADWLKKGEPK